MRPTSWRSDVAVSLALFAVAATAFRDILALPWTGIDAFPTILAASADSFGDLIGVFGRELRGGAEEVIGYYRPLTLLTYTIDHALWGWAPRGYHLTDLLVHALATVSVFWLARVAFGRARWAAASVALLFALHPTTIELVPAITRRQEPLLVIGICVAILGARSIDRRSGWLTMVIGSVIAAMSVERGLAIPGIVFAYLLVRADPITPLLLRARSALRETAPVLAVALIVYGMRALVVTGSGVTFTPGTALRIPFRVGLALVYPQQLFDLRAPSAPLGIVLFLAIAIAIGAGAVWLLARSRERWIYWFALMSIAAYFGLFSIAGQGNPWYAYTAVPAYALALVALAQEGVRAARERRRMVAGGTLVTAAILVAAVTIPSPAFHRYGAWREAGRLGRAVLQDLQAAADTLSDDVSIVAINVPSYFRESDSDYLVTNTASILLTHAIDAWRTVRDVKNPVVMLGASRQVASFAMPHIEFTGTDSVRIFFDTGHASYDDPAPIAGTPLPPRLGRGHTFAWPPAPAPLAVFVFDGQRLRGLRVAVPEGLP
ncbi:MAG TPA: hypothetical protein VGA37_03710 [Gemmatimonadales bacterium]